MARINVEDSIWSDPRFLKLCVKLGDQFKAVGMMVMAWRLAQEFWCPSKSLIPKKRWLESELPDLLFDCGLAEIEDGAVYVRGTEENFEWYFERLEAARKGAATTNAKRWGKPKVVAIATSSDAPANVTVAQSQQTSVSSSSSFSFSKKEEIESSIEEWGKTLSRLEITKDPKLDESVIAQLLARYGFDKTVLALLGAGFEEGSKDYDPKKHVSIRRLLKPDIFETFVNLGAQNKPKDREVQEWGIGPC